MVEFLATGIVSAVGIGAVIALITSWIGGKRLSLIAGVILVFVLCLAYHALAVLCMGIPIFHVLMFTVIVPFGYGFGEGNRSFVVALFIQAILSGFIGMGFYGLVNKRK